MPKSTSTSPTSRQCGFAAGVERHSRRCESLEQRWEREVAPHLAAANVKDLDALAAKVEEARALDASIDAKDAELESLRVQIASLAGSADSLREASERATTARAALGDVSLDTLASDLATLGADPTGTLRKRRQQLSTDVEAARAVASQAGTNHTLAEERSRTSKAALDAAVVARDAALAAFPGGVTVALSAARASLAAASEEQKKLATEVAALESTIAAEAARIEAAVSGTRLAAEHARTAVESCATGADKGDRRACVASRSARGTAEAARLSGSRGRGEPVARSSRPSCRRTRARANGDRCGSYGSAECRSEREG